MAQRFLVNDVATLALASLWHNRRLSVFTMIIYAAIVAPVAILYLLKSGVITAWTHELSRDVQSREIDIRGEYNKRLTPEEIQRLGDLPGVDFVVGEAMALVSTRQMRRTTPERGPTQQIKIRTSAAGDPLLPDRTTLRLDEMALSAGAAKQLQAAPGDTISITLRRLSADGKSETHRLPFIVTHVIDPRKWPGDVAFVRPRVAVAMGNWISGTLDDIVQVQTPDASARFASFRIYASSVHQATTLRQTLSDNGYEAGLRVAAVSRMLFLEHGLNLVFQVILVLALCGLIASILLLQWLSLERQKSDLALLLTTGFSQGRIRAFVLMQAIVLSVAGLVLATAVSVAAFTGLAPIVLQQIELNTHTLFWPPLGQSTLLLLSTFMFFSGVSWLSVKRLSIAPLVAALRSD